MTVYLDSVIGIYLLDHIGEFHDRALRHVGRLSARGDTFVASDLTRLECLVRPIRDGNAARLAEFDRFFAQPDVRLVPLSRSAYHIAAAICAQYKFKTPDALHLAAAIESGCDLFLTHDIRLQVFQGISVELLG